MFPFAIVSLLQLLNPQNSLEGSEGLKFLIGDWTSHESTKGADGKEIPFDLKGTNRWILEGNCLQIDESFEVPSQGKFGNHILMSYDKGQKVFRAWWFTSTGPTPLVFTGHRTDKTFVLTKDDGRLRISYDLLEDGHYKAFVETKRGEDWLRLTEAEYRRTGK